jgi:cyclohexanone monooxygenase
MAKFPNLFMITGPGSPSVLSNVLLAIEQHVDWITNCLQYMTENQFSLIEPTHEAEKNWVHHVNEVAEDTLYVHSDSWYMGANIPGKPRVFMPYVGGADKYRDICKHVSQNKYYGFSLSN